MRACWGSVASVLVMNTSACDAEMTQLLSVSARSTTEPDGDRFACDTGAQKWLRDSASEKASAIVFTGFGLGRARAGRRKGESRRAG